MQKSLGTGDNPTLNDNETSIYGTKDGTTSIGILPQTGANGMKIMVLIVTLLSSIIFYKKYKQYNYR